MEMRREQRAMQAEDEDAMEAEAAAQPTAQQHQDGIGAWLDFRSAEDAERAVASAAAAETRRAARPARRTPARRAPATPPPTKRVKVKREGEPRRSVRQVATPKTYNERHLEAAAWAGRGTRDDPFVAA